MNWLTEHIQANPQPAPHNIPVRYQAADLKQLSRNLHDVSVEYLQNFHEYAATGQAPLFLGKARTGKTMAAAFITRIVHERVPLTVHWVNVPQWSVNLFDSVELKLAKLYKVPFLVMDDVHSITQQDRRPFNALQAVLSTRWDAQLPTLITGNVELPEGDEWKTLANVFGPALARRMQDGSVGLTVLL